LERANILSDLGSVYVSEQEYAKAGRVYSEALSLYRMLSNKSLSALMLHNLGMLDSVQGRNDNALRVMTQAFDLLKSEPKTDVGVTAQLLNGLGIIHYRLGKAGKAEMFFTRALRVIADAGIQVDTGGILNNLGSVYIAQHKYQKAEDALTRALQIREAEDGASSPDLIVTLNALGVLYVEMKRYPEAES